MGITDLAGKMIWFSPEPYLILDIRLFVGKFLVTVSGQCDLQNQHF